MVKQNKASRELMTIYPYTTSCLSNMHVYCMWNTIWHDNGLNFSHFYPIILQYCWLSSEQPIRIWLDWYWIVIRRQLHALPCRTAHCKTYHKLPQDRYTVQDDSSHHWGRWDHHNLFHRKRVRKIRESSDNDLTHIVHGHTCSVN